MDRALKNMYNPQSVAALADALHQAYAEFDRQRFVSSVFSDGWDALELKQRMRHITVILHSFLPRDYRTALGILRNALPRLGEQGFEKMIFPDYVEVYGIEDWEASIPALEEFTQYVSAEFAIRAFITRYPDRTMKQMLSWTLHENPEVRRLASEGCRPRLPWAIALPALKSDPSPILRILERLKNDDLDSVRRSVANNLNDISKDRPAVVIDLLRSWEADDRPGIRWIIRHALRTLLKKGDPAAFELLGYPTDPKVRVFNVAVKPAFVEIGGEVLFSFDVDSQSDAIQNLMIDFVVHFVKANGRRLPKVFKLTNKRLRPGDALRIQKVISFVPITTRRYYPGKHIVQPQINGRLFHEVEFVVDETTS